MPSLKGPIMNSRKSNALFAVVAFAAIAAAVATPARADDITIDNTPFHSTKTRAEVQAELLQYQRAGVNPYKTGYNQLAQFRSTRARADVRGDYLAHRDEVNAMLHEGSDSHPTVRTAAVPRVRNAATLAGVPVNGH
jgi:hypothetical protein